MSNRATVLLAIEKLGKASFEEITDISGLGGQTTRFTLGDLRKIKLVESERDEITRLSRYCLTWAGQEWLNENRPNGEPAEQVAMPTDKACCNAAKVVATTAGAEVAGLRKTIQAQATEIENRDLAIQGLSARIASLEIALDSANQIIHRMELEAEQAKDVKELAVGYVVKAPKRKARVLTKPESARNAALSAAKATGCAEVFALVKVGKATRKQIRTVDFKEAA